MVGSTALAGRIQLCELSNGDLIAGIFDKAS
jgi:hypothetical protein